jgi:hypothetical protein
MKKQLLTLLTIAISSTGLLAQVKKTTKKPSVNSVTSVAPVATIKPIIDAEESAKINAEKWFREIYVDKFFKDPYSYKLLKLTSEKITVKQMLVDSLLYLDDEIKKCTISENSRTLAKRSEWQVAYDEGLLYMKKDEENLKNEKDSKRFDYWNKRISIHKKYLLEILPILKEYAIYFLNAEEKNRIEGKLRSISQEQEQKLAFYKVKIDCYSKNSLGNEVLGRYQFPFTEKGITGTGDGTSSVIHLNKE